MIVISIGFFALAALLGFYLLTFILQQKDTPKGIVFIHGPLAVIGLIILIIYALLYQPAQIISIIIFILAALGGFIMIMRDLMGKSVPRWLAITHGSVALIGFVCLVILAFVAHRP